MASRDCNGPAGSEDSDCPEEDVAGDEDENSELAFVQIIRGGGKPLATQSILMENPRTMLVSVGSIDHLGATKLFRDEKGRRGVV